MGYYSGSGVVSGGGESVSVLESFVFFGAHNVYQKTRSTVTRKSGVSLATAQAATGDCSMSTHQFSWPITGSTAYHYCPNAYGNKTDVSYSQIGDSNLYELVTTEQSIKAKMDGGGWVG